SQAHKPIYEINLCNRRKANINFYLLKKKFFILLYFTRKIQIPFTDFHSHRTCNFSLNSALLKHTKEKIFLSLSTPVFTCKYKYFFHPGGKNIRLYVSK